MQVVDVWKKFQHSNVVQLREVFTTKAFGDNCEFIKFNESSNFAFELQFFWQVTSIFFLKNSERNN